MSLLLGSFARLRTGSMLQLRQFHASFHPCRGKPITAEESATILRMYKERKTLQNIASFIGRPTPTVTTRIRKFRLDGLVERRRAAAGKPLTTEESATILRMYNERKTLQNIASFVGRPTPTVTTRIRKFRLDGLVERRNVAEGKPLNTAELELLKTARDEYKSWSDCVSMFPSRSPAFLYQQYYRPRDGKRSSYVYWSEDDDRRIKTLREEQNLHFTQIARLMPLRSEDSIQARYARTVPRHSRPKISHPTRWSEAATNELKSRLADGEKHHEIAVSMGRSLSSVRNKVYAMKSVHCPDPKEHASKIRWTPEETALLIAEKSKGKSARQLADVLGKSISAVNKKWVLCRKGPITTGSRSPRKLNAQEGDRQE